MIAQVKHISAEPAAPNLVRVPGILVDYIVVVGEDPELHAMTFAEYSNPSYTAPAPGTAATPTTTQKVSKVVDQTDFQFQPVALNARIVAQRRAALEIAKHAPKIVNLGVGMPAAIGAVALAAGINGFVLTLESGPIGGTPADGLSFGASAYPQAIIDQPSQFDFYDGGGIDLAMLGIGEFDIKGNVNVSVFGQGANRIIAGVGGFINITQSTRKLVFVGTLTSGGLEIEVSNGAMRIVREGKNRKLVSAVEHLSFNASYVASLGTTMTYITERAVFELGTDGVLQITEIAQGIDLEKDVLAICPKGITISKHLKMFDPKVLR